MVRSSWMDEEIEQMIQDYKQQAFWDLLIYRYLFVFALKIEEILQTNKFNYSSDKTTSRKNKWHVSSIAGHYQFSYLNHACECGFFISQ